MIARKTRGVLALAAQNDKMTKLIQRADEGRAFEIDGDRVSIKVCARDTNGVYSLMHWIVAPLSSAPGHIHERYEETFYVLGGNLEFILGHQTIPMNAGDFVRVPAGTRHAYQNNTEATVELLVGFTPGGMEELFFKFRTEAGEFNTEAYLKEAKEIHGTEYESGS